MSKTGEDQDKPKELSEFTLLWWKKLDDEYWYELAHSGYRKWNFQLPEHLKVIVYPNKDRLLSVKKRVKSNSLIYQFTPIFATFNEFEEISDPIISKIYSKFQAFDDESSNAFSRLVIQVFVACEVSNKFKTQILCLKHQKSDIETKPIYQYSNQLICFRVVDALTKLIPTIAENKIKRLIIYINTLICICNVNFANFIDNESLIIGYYLDPIFSLINHSCLPNIKIICDDLQHGSLKIITTTSIRQILYTNYCSRIFPTPIRQYDLLFRFNFVCQCQLCVNSIDYLFSYNCPKCQAILCYPKFSSFLYDHTYSNVVFISGVCLQCKNCRCKVGYQKFQKNYLIHKLSILLVVFLIQDSVDKQFDSFLQFLEKIRLVIPRYILDYQLFLSKLTTLEYDTTRNFGRIYKILQNIIKKDGIIPAYCFPFSIFYQFSQIELNQRYQLSDEIEHDLNFLIQQLKLRFQNTFLISIPADLNSHYKLANSDYRQISLDLWMLIKYFLKLRKPQYSNVLKILTWNCMFFCSRAIESYQNHNSSVVTELNNLLELVNQQNDDIFDENSFEQYLIPMLKFCKVDHVFSYKKKRILIQTMSRNNMVLFDEIQDKLRI